MASVVDIVTLENFASKMPSWHHNLSSHLYALVDMGSNGIRFSISDLSPPHPRLLKCLYRERAAISLFDALNDSTSGCPLTFSQNVISQVSQTLVRFKAIASEFGVPVEHISVFATEAMRKSSNAIAMLDAIKSESGLHVYILAPEVETLFGAMGARSGFAAVNGLFLDLGGGSVQMTYLNSATAGYETQAARAGKSLPFGAARLIGILDNENADTQAIALDELKTGMHGAFFRLKQEFPFLGDEQVKTNSSGIDIYLCGGGFRGYGSILMHNDPIYPYPVPAIGAYTVDGSFFKNTALMRKTNEEHDGKIFGMSKRRRRQFPAIATVVDALINAVPRIRTVTFCSGGNREGALFMTLPISIREASPLPLLRESSITNPPDTGHITKLIQSTLPLSVGQSAIPTVLSLGIGPLFADEIWLRTGEPNEANASFQLHRSLGRDPGAPGLTHLARSVLGLTLCFRWGAVLGPIDQQLFKGLRTLVYRASPDAVFWAEYIGEVAHLISQLFPRAPKSQEQLNSIANFKASFDTDNGKTKLRLTVALSPATYRSIDRHQLSNSFKHIGKARDGTDKSRYKVEISLQPMES